MLPLHAGQRYGVVTDVATFGRSRELAAPLREKSVGSCARRLAVAEARRARHDLGLDDGALVCDGVRSRVGRERPVRSGFTLGRGSGCTNPEARYPSG